MSWCLFFCVLLFRVRDNYILTACDGDVERAGGGGVVGMNSADCAITSRFFFFAVLVLRGTDEHFLQRQESAMFGYTWFNLDLWWCWSEWERSISVGLYACRVLVRVFHDELHFFRGGIDPCTYSLYHSCNVRQNAMNNTLDYYFCDEG